MFYFYLALLILAVFIDDTMMATNSFDSFRRISISGFRFNFSIIVISSIISRKKLLSSASSSTIFNLLIKSTADLALCEDL